MKFLSVDAFITLRAMNHFVLQVKNICFDALAILAFFKSWSNQISVFFDVSGVVLYDLLVFMAFGGVFLVLFSEVISLNTMLFTFVRLVKWKAHHWKYQGLDSIHEINCLEWRFFTMFEIKTITQESKLQRQEDEQVCNWSVKTEGFYRRRPFIV